MMRAGLATTVGMAVLAWACSGDPSALPPPTIVGVEPATLPVNAKDEDVTVRFDARYSMAVDYGEEKVDARMGSGRIWMDEQEAVVSSFDPAGVAIVTVPRGLGAGPHAVRLRLDDGREAVAEGALTLRPPGQEVIDPPLTEDAGILILTDAGPLESDFDGGVDTTDGGEQVDAGPGPDVPMRAGDITGFSFDVIEGTRVSRTAFAITVRAQGPRAGHFQGSVELSASRGTVTPSKIGPCDVGVCNANIVMDAPAGNVRLTAMDSFGVSGDSNTFRLEPYK
ncbi:MULTISPECIES: hypothetical protein [unclassified Corallococcus]|uniref:hypothetical protein n=1 Tax=unclassified Corallococcus TaxID=2685029 RepID=UPI001A8DFF80|nr:MULTISPECIES: hypothetical protein [unclassified Corallococcus]MBN9685456.1 hypothetical protein [Corallococcus sp. NCSPR001]WAS83096.1 hypothetical protein O0N60_27690 [Corallococcus sp. NCRR]